jgi:pyruvate formate lyase activating enzyme
MRMGKPVWVASCWSPGLTDAPENIEKVARFVGPMKNVEWVEVLPFHQMGAFKWTSLRASTIRSTTRIRRARRR